MARSKEIAPSVGRLSRSQVAAKRGLHKGECWLWMDLDGVWVWGVRGGGLNLGRTEKEEKRAGLANGWDILERAGASDWVQGCADAAGEMAYGGSAVAQRKTAECSFNRDNRDIPNV